MRDELLRLPFLVNAHLALTLFPLLLGLVLSIPLGILCARSVWLERLVLNAAGVIQTVPSLALLALMVPVLAALGTSSIGYLPAFLALVLYSLLPILRNTVTGLTGIDPAIVEAARGVGMNERQRLWRVELPLALPVIVAGVRTAAVWTVGAATLATPIGADSLGNYIFSGLQTRNVGSVLLGCVASAGLALVLDGLGRLLFAGVSSARRGLTFGALAGFVVLATWSGFALARRPPADAAFVTVGAKTFTEQYVLSEILAERLARETGTEYGLRQSLGSTVAFDALRSGDIDTYVDYSGTIWSTIMKRDDLPASREEVLRTMREFLRARHGVEVVAALGFENTYALAMRRDRAESLGVRTITDLRRVARNLTLGGDYEFFGRPEWKRLKAAYDLTFRGQAAMDSSLMYDALVAGAIDLATVFSTDGRIAALNLVVLNDDRRAIPPYDAVVLAGRRLATNRRAMRALSGLEHTINAARMRSMNSAVDLGGRSPHEVAVDFLRTLGSETSSEAK